MIAELFHKINSNSSILAIPDSDIIPPDGTERYIQYGYNASEMIETCIRDNSDFVVIPMRYHNKNADMSDYEKVLTEIDCAADSMDYYFHNAKNSASPLFYIIFRNITDPHRPVTENIHYLQLLNPRRFLQKMLVG